MSTSMSPVTLGAYRVRYLFVICGFSLAEAENPKSDFSWVEPLTPTIWNLFDIRLKTQD